MDIGVYSIESVSDEQVISLIDARQSFVLQHVDLLKMGDAVKTIEKILDAKGLKCRTYTKFRAAAIAGAAIPVNVAAAAAVSIVGFAAAIGIGVHRLATWGPDYEIAKNLVTGTLTVTYKK